MTVPLIYICEDDPSLGRAVQLRIQQEGYECQLFGDGAELDESANHLMPDVLLLDVQLPGESGYSIAQRYLRSVPNLRVIMMSVLNQPQDLLTGYDSGAMLYLPKPFKPEALVACLKGIFAPLKGVQQAETTLTLDLVTHKLSYLGGVILLTENEATVLAAMALQSPAAIEYHELMEALGLDLDSARKNTLETLISRLRTKLAVIDRSDLTIKNMRNLGYQLTAKSLVIR